MTKKLDTMTKKVDTAHARHRCIVDLRNEILEDAIALQRRAMERFQVDLFESPKFIEAIVRRVCGLDGTDTRTHWDGETPKGDRVEIKSSVTKPGNHGGRRFTWGKLQGYDGTGKDADVFVLVGYDSENDSDPFTFLVMPSVVIGKRKWLQYSLKKRKDGRSNKWSEFITPVSELYDAVRRYAQWNGTWDGNSAD